MRPWKSFVGSVSVVALLTAGAFGAGSGVIPFSHASESTAPTEAVDESPAGDEAAPPAEPLEEVGEVTTTTTGLEDDVADADDSDTEEGTDTDEDDTPPAVVVDLSADTPPAPAGDEAPPATPAENDAPVICAAASESECGPVETTPPANATFEARVQRCQDWWNRLADRLDDRKPKWAERARRVAERCEAIAMRWQERHGRWQENHGRWQENHGRWQENHDRWHEKRDRKGDHNCDGHPDNGWHNKDRPECPTPPGTAEPPAGQKPDKGDRPKASSDRAGKSR